MVHAGVRQRGRDVNPGAGLRATYWTCGKRLNSQGLGLSGSRCGSSSLENNTACHRVSSDAGQVVHRPCVRTTTLLVGFAHPLMPPENFSWHHVNQLCLEVSWATGKFVLVLFNHSINSSSRNTCVAFLVSLEALM